MKKYGIDKICEFCSAHFITKPRFVKYCSTPCKNPINRKGNVAWNKGQKMTDEQKSKMNQDGLAKGRGWNKGLLNLEQSLRWTGENNPNWDGKLNELRSKKPVDSKFLVYKGLCGRATYRSVKQMTNEGIVPVTGKHKTDMQLDHIIPYMQGYENNIDPLIIGSKANLQYITGAENRKKWDTFQHIETVNRIIAEYEAL